MQGDCILTQEQEPIKISVSLRRTCQVDTLWLAIMLSETMTVRSTIPSLSLDHFHPMPSSLQIISYTDRGTGGRQDLSLWQPITGNNRYVCLGTVASLDYSAPTGLRHKYACLRKELVEQGIFGYEIWNDRGSGGREDVSLWSVESYSHRSSGYFVANNRYSKPRPYYAMAVKGI